MDAVSKNRILSVDALRGISILLMFLSGQVPFYKNTLPAWMYHAQVPPPFHQFNPNLPGLTWVDLVFPFFLFTMGAAIPFALINRINKGESLFKIIQHIVIRYISLIFFAIFLQHIKPYALNSTPNVLTWVISLFGFTLLFPILLRFSTHFPKKAKYILQISGFLLIIILLVLINNVIGLKFSLNRSDIIIVVLANVSLTGSILWIITRNNLLIKFGVLGILLAFRLSHTEIGWVSYIWNFSPIPWAYTFYYLQYLFIVIPGIIIGDMILLFVNQKGEIAHTTKRNNKFIAISVLMFIVTPISLICLKERLILLLIFTFIIWAIVTTKLLQKEVDKFSQLLKNINYYGIYFFALGLIFEPYEGGIKKDHPTLSYYFITVGISIFTLIALTIIIDYFKQKKFLDLFVKNGQNPLIAYAGITNLIPPLLGITGVDYLLGLIVINPWMGLVKGVVITLLLGIIVSYFTKLKIFLRT